MKKYLITILLLLFTTNAYAVDDGAGTEHIINDVQITTGKNVTVGSTQWNSADEIDGTKIKDADYGDVTIDAAGDWDVENATTATTASSGDAAVDFFGAGVDAVTDATTCTDIEGTKLSITGVTLNVTETDDIVGAITGIVKADGGGNISAATSNTDYLPPVGPILNNGETSAGYIDFLEDSDNGTDYVRLLGPPSTGTVTINFGPAAGIVTTDVTACTDLEGTSLAITAGVLNVDNIAVATLADGTDGELITWDANGAPAVVAVGTAGQVLTSGGAGVAPTFEAAAGGGGVEVGSITAYGGSSAPSGYVLCDGTAYSRTVTYDTLFGVISDAYGVGDGSTTFNVPDLRGRVPLGKDDMGGSSADRVTGTQADNIGEGSGAETHALSIAELASHDHSFKYKAGSTGTLTNTTYPAATSMGGNPDGPSTNTVIIGDTGSGTAHNNMSPYQTVNYIIKY